MHELPPMPEKKLTRKELVELAKKLSQRTEGFPFRGIEDASLTKLKADDEECPGFVTPIDTLVIQLETQSMKVVLGDDPDSGNVFILPRDSDNVVEDSVLPRHLKVSDDMDPDLRKLILHSKKV